MLSTFLTFVAFCLFLMTVVGITFMITLAMPQSKMRDCVLQVVGFGFAAFSVLYAVSPDLIPFCPLDDIAVLAGGIIAGLQALQAHERQKAGHRIAA
jgi:hypothetical protein